MNYPLISEYIEAIRYAEDNFATLTNLRPELDDNGNPIMSSGNFAVVFKMKDVSTGKLHALKCFTREQKGRSDSYKLISEELQKVNSPYVIKVEYLEKELFVDTSLSEETEFPVLLMDWVEGQTLTAFLQEMREICCADYYDCIPWTDVVKLKSLPFCFLRMASWLLEQPFAHGDIKPDNIIIKPDGICVLVDYDGMFVPAMQGMKSQSQGTPNFRHPLVLDYTFGKNIDNYSISIIALSLSAYAINPFLLVDSEGLCLITEKETSRLWEHFIFKNEELMSDKFFKELLAIYLHTLNQNKLDADYLDKSIAEYLCPSDYDVSNTEVTEYDTEHFWEDEYGVRYSLDGRKVIEATKDLDGIDYKIREGVLTICNQAFQSKTLHRISLPNSVLAIGDRAFANNDDMEYCNIPCAVKFVYDNNPWGGCFNIKRMDCMSPHYIIKDGILYSSDYRVVYGFIYWQSKVSIDFRARKISSNAFWSGRKEYEDIIETVEVNNVVEIGERAFRNCRKAKFYKTGTLEKLGNGAFEGCASMERIDISRVKIIPKEGFEGCSKLKEIIYSQELIGIEEYAFFGCALLEIINIPKSVVYIKRSAFEECKSLNEFIVDKNNENYASVGGILFNKSVTKLIKYPTRRKNAEYVIPSSVCEIGNNAFSGNDSIERVVCDHDLFNFGLCVFNNCPKLNFCNLTLAEGADRESLWNLANYNNYRWFDLMHKASKLENARAQWELAVYYRKGANGVIYFSKYIYWLERAASNGELIAMSRLGQELLIGENIEVDEKRAFQLLNKVSEEIKKNIFSFIAAGYHWFAPLGTFYEKGLFVVKDESRAFQLYEKGARFHDSYAEYCLGRCYENGIGVKVDLVKAKEYYESAKEHYREDTMSSLKDIEKAIDRIRRTSNLISLDW